MRRAGATVAALTMATGALVVAPAAAVPTPTYYVAMGDSLGAGTGASPGSNSYVNLIYAHELALTPGLQLRNFSCGGATTSSVVNGHNGANCTPATTQLATAEAFLKAHPGQIAFVTIDIGANDVDGCSNGTTIDNACLAAGLSAVNTNLPLIISGLKAAYPGIRIFGMNYYDPFLAAWLQGPAGQTLAQQSVGQADAFNSLLANLYTAGGFPTADVATGFQNDDFSLTGDYNGQTEPQNVADICNWTHMCEASDIHANNTGHAVLAQSFEPLIDTPVAPDPPIGVVVAAGNASALVHWSVPATSSSTITGYVVTPYLGSVAQAGQIFNTAATTETVTGLANAKSYTFRVAARNAIGTGPKSAATAAVTVGAPATASAARALSEWTNSTTGTLSVTFAAGASNGAPITKYTATCSSSSGGTSRVGVRTGPAAGAIAVAGVSTTKSYSCRVTATNARGVGVASVASAPVVVGAPGPAPRPTAVPTAPGTLRVSFLPPANNGAAINNFTVTCTSSNGGALRTKVGLAIALVVTPLTPTKSYTCTVRATNSRGTGPASAPSAPVSA